MNITKVELYIVDFDLLGELEIKKVLENTKYPNRCICPHVLSTETKSIEWSDNCDYNNTKKAPDAVRELFN